MSTRKSRRGPRRLVEALVHQAASALVAALFAVPFIWVISASLRQPGLPPPNTVEWLPEPVVWANYRRIFQLVPLDLFTFNSLIVVSLAVPITLITASWAGFAMAQLQGHVRRRLVLFAVLLRMVPITALWLTRFVILQNLGLIDTIWVLILPAFMGSSPFYVLLFYWTFRRIPEELFDSAHVDGAGVLRIWRSIAMPVARPTSVAVGMLTFAMYWSDFITPLLYLKSEHRYTLPVGLQVLQQMDKTNWPLLMAASVVMTMPVVVLFLLVQRYVWPESRLVGMKG